MNIEVNTVRLLGAAQLIVIVGALITDRLLTVSVGSGSISNMLVNISENITSMRISNLVALGNSLVVVFLGVMYYAVFNQPYKTISLVALGFFLAAAITLALSKIGGFALIPLSQKFVEAGAPETAYFQTMGDFLYYGVDKLGSDLYMFFTCMSLMLWNYLFYVSRYIPRAISVWGLIAIFLLAIPVVLVLYNRDFRDSPLMMLAIPYAPY